MFVVDWWTLMSVQREVSDRLDRRPRPLFWLAMLGILLAIIAIILIWDGLAGDDADGDSGATVLTETDNGSTVDLTTGDRLTIRLESNPTTGYEWAIAEIDEQMLTYLSGSYEPEDDGLVGQGGIQEMTFEAAQAGESVLGLKYWRSWEGDDSIEDRFEVTVVISSE
jgi:inhibitor of cysteine peptidase